MIALVLERTGEVEDMGMVGNLYVDGTFYGKTMEQNWRDNQRNISCIPEGSYALKPVTSPKWGKTLALVNPMIGVHITEEECNNVHERFACLLHRANWARELEGCVSVGKKHACGQKKRYLPTELMITSSKSMTEKLIDMVYEAGEGILDIHYKQIKWSKPDAF